LQCQGGAVPGQREVPPADRVLAVIPERGLPERGDTAEIDAVEDEFDAHTTMLALDPGDTQNVLIGHGMIGRTADKIAAHSGGSARVLPDCLHHSA
jgi:hypothetical protein